MSDHIPTDLVSRVKRMRDEAMPLSAGSKEQSEFFNVGADDTGIKRWIRLDDISAIEEVRPGMGWVDGIVVCLRMRHSPTPIAIDTRGYSAPGIGLFANQWAVLKERLGLTDKPSERGR